jgi:hypothetical protein
MNVFIEKVDDEGKEDEGEGFRESSTNPDVDSAVGGVDVDDGAGKGS